MNHDCGRDADAPMVRSVMAHNRASRTASAAREVALFAFLLLVLAVFLGAPIAFLTLP